MAVASGPIAAPALSVPSSRWRSRPVQVALIVAVMLVLFALFRGEYPWPASLTWSQLPDKLDELQDWLLDERTAADPNIVFAIFDGFRVLADWLVTALTDALEWLTWVGTLAGSALLVWRFGGLRPALIVVAAWVSFALMGLWEESVQTLALMLAAVALSLVIGIPIGIVAGRSPGFHRTADAVPRRRADHPRVRVPDAGRDPVLGRPGRRRDLHDDLRGPAGRPDHRARDPQRHARHRRGRERVRRDALADAVEGAAAARAPPDPAVGQPDDHVRAVAGRDRRADRREGPRRRGDERALLERRARAAGGDRDRDHGDRARPRHAGDRRAHRPDAPAPDRRAEGARAAQHAARARRRSP